MKKLILITISAIVTIFAALSIYIFVILDPNDYRSDIISQVKLNSGHDLVIEGDLSWRFLPNLGLTLGHTQILNPEGFPEKSFLEFNHAQIDLALLPLLSNKIQVGQISIDGLSIYLHTRKDGKSNLDALAEASAEENSLVENTTTDVQDAELTESKNDTRIEVAGITVSNAKLVINDELTNSLQTIDAINFELKKFDLEQEVPVDFSATINADGMKIIIESAAQIKISAQMNRFDFIDLRNNIKLIGESIPNKEMTINNQLSGYFDSAAQIFSVSEMTTEVLDTKIKGNLLVKLAQTIPDISFDLNIDKLNVDQFLDDAEEDVAAESSVSTQQPDLSWMKSFKLKGLITLDAVTANNLKISDIKLPLLLTNAVFSVSPLTAKFYEGELSTNLKLNAQRSIATYSFDTTIAKVQAQPMIVALLEDELIRGELNMTMDLSGKGLDVASIKEKMKGTGNFAFTDGALQGVNIQQLIRKTYFLYKGISIKDTAEVDETVFSAFTGSFSLKDGVINNPDLKLFSSALNLSGSGKADIIKESVNYRLKASLVGTIQDDEGVDVKDLNRLVIPVKVKGSMNNPKYSIDMEELLKEDVKEKLLDKVKDKLRGLFGG